MSLSEQFNVGARIKAKVALSNQSFAPTSASVSKDVTTQDGVTIDRNESGFRRYYSCKAIVAGTWTALTSQAVQAVSVLVQHSSDGTSWDAYTTALSGTFGSSSTAGSTGTTGGAAYQTIEQSVNLNGARRYLRIQIPAFSFADCSSGRSLTVAGAVVFGGADQLPAQ